MANTTESGVPRIDEWALMSKISKGCEASFNVLYREYQPRLILFLRRRLKDDQLIEEVAADTLMTARDKASSFYGGGQLSTWIFSIAARKATRAGEKNRRRDHHLPATTFRDSQHGQRLISLRREAKDWLQHALKQLPTGQRDAVRLHSVDGYSQEEVAQKLEVPLGTIKTRIHHARRRLRTWFKQS